MDDEQILLIMDALNKKYSAEDSGICLVQPDTKYQLCSKKEFVEAVRNVLDLKRNAPLSQAAFEVLAIIAYNEPLTRGEVDEIRGVDSVYVLRRLLAKGLIKECGKSDKPGHPILYKTTDEFLDYFGLSTKEELPKIEILTEEENLEKDLFKSTYKDNTNE